MRSGHLRFIGCVVAAAGLIVLARVCAGAERARPATSAKAAGAGQWVQKGAMPVARSGATAVVVGERIYVVGGDEAQTIGAYDPVADRWEKLTTIPANMRREYQSAVAWDGKIVLIGGMVGGSERAIGRFMADVFQFDVRSQKWARLPSLPAARAGVAAVACGGKLYVAGGWAEGPRDCAETYELESAAGRWVKRASMRRARHAAPAVECEGRVYVMCGGLMNGPVADVEAYDPRTDRWEPRRSGPTAKGYFQAVTLGGRIYCMNGDDDMKIGLYDPGADRWEQIDRPDGVVMSAAAEFAGSIYVFGGIGLERRRANDFSGRLRSVWQYTPAGR